MTKTSKKHDKYTEFRYVQDKLIEILLKPSFEFELPPLSRKRQLAIATDAAERERLEFMGDNLAATIVSEIMYKLFPQGTPKFYTVVRSVLTSNLTFAHFMAKTGAYRFQPGAKVKPAGDAFETILFSFSLQCREEDAMRVEEHPWVKEYIVPLVRSIGTFAWPLLNQKIKRAGLNPVLAAIAQRDLKRDSKGKQRARPSIIDLTELEDSSDEDVPSESDESDDEVEVVVREGISISKIPQTKTRAVWKQDILRAVSCAPPRMSKPLPLPPRSPLPLFLGDGSEDDPIMID